MTHAYPWEIVQLIVAVCGAVLGLLGLWDAIRDSTSLGVTNGSRIIATGNLRNEALRLMVQVILALIGVVSVVLPPPPLPPPITFDGVVSTDTGDGQVTIIRIALASLTIILTLGSLADRLDRQKLRSLYARTGPLRRRDDSPLADQIAGPLAVADSPSARTEPGVQASTAAASLKNIDENTEKTAKNTERTEATVQELKDQAP